MLDFGCFNLAVPLEWSNAPENASRVQSQFLKKAVRQQAGI